MAKRTTIGILVAGGLVVALALAFFVSPYASSSPDGLAKVAADEGIDAGQMDHTFSAGPLADYEVKGVDDTKLSAGLAGIIGVTVTFVIGLGLFVILRNVRGRDQPTSASGAGPAIPSGP